jgi:hypothetical protein
VRDLPESFEALKSTVEAQIKDERDPVTQPQLNVRDFSIKYVDGD